MIAVVIAFTLDAVALVTASVITTLNSTMIAAVIAASIAAVTHTVVIATTSAKATTITIVSVAFVPLSPKLIRFTATVFWYDLTRIIAVVAAIFAISAHCHC